MHDVIWWSLALFILGWALPGFVSIFIWRKTLMLVNHETEDGGPSFRDLILIFIVCIVFGLISLGASVFFIGILPKAAEEPEPAEDGN